MRVLVTGANGLVGSRLCALLARGGHDVLGIGRGPRRSDGAWAWSTVELSRAEEVLGQVAGFQPEAIVHTASMTDVDGCEKAPLEAFLANVEATRHVAQAAREVSAHLVHVSTDYVFDGERGNYSEEDLPNPKGTYAVTKHMGEQAVRVLAPSWSIARTAVVYGWPAAGRPNFGSWLVSALEKEQEVRLFQDQFVSPSLADSVAEMLAELALRRLSGVWNTCGADVVNRVDFARHLCRAFDFNEKLLLPTRMADVKLASPRPYRSGLLTEKAQRHLSARPLPLADALGRFRQAYRESKGR